MQYAIQIQFENSWIFVTEGFGKTVKTFDNKDYAEHMLTVWNKSRVVEYAHD
jgi:hypothetical protein